MHVGKNQFVVGNHEINREIDDLLKCDGVDVFMFSDLSLAIFKVVAIWPTSKSHFDSSSLDASRHKKVNELVSSCARCLSLSISCLVDADLVRCAACELAGSDCFRLRQMCGSFDQETNNRQVNYSYHEFVWATDVLL